MSTDFHNMKRYGTDYFLGHDCTTLAEKKQKKLVKLRRALVIKHGKISYKWQCQHGLMEKNKLPSGKLT